MVQAQIKMVEILQCRTLHKIQIVFKMNQAKRKRKELKSMFKLLIKMINQLLMMETTKIILIYLPQLVQKRKLIIQGQKVMMKILPCMMWLYKNSMATITK